MWPFAVFALELRRFGNTNWKLVFLFMIFSSLTLSSVSTTSDIRKQVEHYERFKKQDMSFSELNSTMYVTENEAFAHKNFDWVQTLTWWILGKFNAPKELLYLFMGILLAIPAIYNLRLLEEKCGDLGFMWSLILILALIYITPFWDINGFRFHMGTHVAISAIFTFFLTPYKKRAIFLWLSTSIIHFGYLFFIPILPILYLLRRFEIPALATSIFLNLFSTQGLFISGRSFIYNYIPKAFIEQGDDYINDEKLQYSSQMINVGKSFHAAFYQEAIHYFIFVVSVVMFFILRKKGDHFNYQKPSQLLVVLLFVNGLIGVFDTVPGAKRFEVIEQTLLLTLVILIFSTKGYDFLKRKTSNVLAIFSPLFFFWLIVQIRKSFDFLTISTLFGNAFNFMGGNDFPLIHLIK